MLQCSILSERVNLNKYVLDGSCAMSENPNRFLPGTRSEITMLVFIS